MRKRSNRLRANIFGSLSWLGYLRDDTSPGDDDMLSRVAREDVGGDLEVRFWRDGEQLEQQLAAAMQKHLKLTEDKKAYQSFNNSIGMPENGDPDPTLAEGWQILSPVRNHEFGTTEINRKIQAKYRGGLLMKAKSPWSNGPKPFGEQEIVWTDKVIQSVNCKKTCYPKGEGLDYVANGEIGLVVETRKGNDKPDSLKVQFSWVVRIEEWPRRAETTGSGTPSARRCDVCVWRSEWRDTPFGSLSLRNSRLTADDIESGFSSEPSGLQKIRSPPW